METGEGSNQEKLLTPQELAEVLSLSVKTVYRMARAGDLPAYRFGDTVRFSLPEVLEASRSSGTSLKEDDQED